MSKFESEKYVMAKQNYDGVIEAVRYQPEGRLDLIRIYERRGPTFSDLLIIDREKLYQRMRKGQKFVVGKRIPYLSTTFDVNASINLIKTDGGYLFSTSKSKVEQDTIEGAPLF